MANAHAFRHAQTHSLKVLWVRGWHTHTEYERTHTQFKCLCVCTHRARINLFSTDRRSISRANLHAHGYRNFCVLVHHQKYRVCIYIVSDGQTAVFTHKLAIDAYALRLSSLRLIQTHERTHILFAQTHNCICARTHLHKFQILDYIEYSTFRRGAAL